MESRIIILNGVGSVGKSSVAQALQAIACEPLLHVKMDAFLEMIPARFWGDPEGITFKPSEDDDPPSVAIETGPVVDRLLEGMRRSVAALAKAGNNCIVDDVMLSPAVQQSYLDACASMQLQFVGLYAPLDILEQRERARGDREIGLARWQQPRVHAGIRYDLEIDTSVKDPATIAQDIAAALAIPVRESW